MNKILLSTLLATTVMFSSVVNAADVKEPQAPNHVQIERPNKPFDKNFHEQFAKKTAEELGLTQEQQEQAKKIRQEGQEKIKPLMEEMKTLRTKIDSERRANM